jgi:hypothetical protein
MFPGYIYIQISDMVFKYIVLNTYEYKYYEVHGEYSFTRKKEKGTKNITFGYWNGRGKINHYALQCIKKCRTS